MNDMPGNAARLAVERSGAAEIQRYHRLWSTLNASPARTAARDLLHDDRVGETGIGGIETAGLG